MMKGARDNYKKLTADDELKELYYAREKRLKDEASRLESAEERGVIKTAAKMKALGVSIDIIMKATSLTKKQIEEL